MTDRYAIFGNPVAHSKSPRIHALFAAQTGEDIQYEAILAPRDDFAGCVRAFARSGGCGANVTLPFKEEAFRLCEQRTARAKAAGAVNTLIIAHEDDSSDQWSVHRAPTGVTPPLGKGVGGKVHLVGDNTDGAGLVRDIEHNLGFAIAGKRILLLGAGGAARGAALPLLHESPLSLTIANRTVEKARKLADVFGAEAHGVLDAGAFESLAGRQFDLVINATSASLADAALPLPAGIFAPDCLAYDMLYGRETPFMRQAAAAGANVADGLGMLIEQAAESFAMWRGVRPQTEPVLKLMRAS